MVDLRVYMAGYKITTPKDKISANCPRLGLMPDDASEVGVKYLFSNHDLVTKKRGSEHFCFPLCAIGVGNGRHLYFLSQIEKDSFNGSSLPCRNQRIDEHVHV